MRLAPCDELDGLFVVDRQAIFSNDDRTIAPHNELHFPFLHEAADGTWYMTHREGPHNRGAKAFGVQWWEERAKLLGDDRVQTVMSHDRGRTWVGWPGLRPESNTIRFFRTRLRDNTLISHHYVIEELIAEEDGTTTGRVTLLRSQDDGATWSNQTSKVTGLPYRATGIAAMWGHFVETEDGRLLLTVYGRDTRHASLEKDRFFLGVLHSTNAGQHWRFLTVAADRTVPGSEGPNEADIVRLGPDSLLIAYRTGRREPDAIFLSRSNDGGRTWSAPERSDILAGVSPQLLLLENGALVMSYGTRVGGEGKVWARASRDRGESWLPPLLLYDGPGSGYTDLQALDNDRFRVVFDESAFGTSEFVERNQIVRVVLRAVPSGP